MSNYPQDEDGEVLAQLEGMGIDMTQPLNLEFSIAADGEESANAIGAALTQKKYDVEVVYDEGEPIEGGEIEEDDEEFGPSWSVYVKRRMVPDYNEIMRIQKDLDATAKPLGGVADGWGAMLGSTRQAE